MQWGCAADKVNHRRQRTSDSPSKHFSNFLIRLNVFSYSLSLWENKQHHIFVFEFRTVMPFHVCLRELYPAADGNRRRVC